MAGLNKLKIGDVLYRVRREKAGNTKCSREVVDEYVVSAIEHAPGFPRVRITQNGRPVLGVRVANLRRSPPEWLRWNPFEARQCYFCRAHESNGHRETCEHPKAVKARAKAKV